MGAPADAIPPGLASLATTFDFTAEQLALNRQGQVADGQLGSLWSAVLMGSAILLFALLGGVLGWKHVRKLYRALGLLAGSLAALIILMIVIIPSARDLAEHSVRSVDGEVAELRIVGKSGDASLVVSGRSLLTRADYADAGRAFESRGRYRFYYLPHTEWLLSLEPLRARGPRP